MPRTRRIYQSKGAYASNSPVTGVSGITFTPLSRLQSIDFDWSRNLESVGQFSQLFSYRIDNAPPTVNGQISYYATNARNEQILGFTVDGTTSFISGILSKETAEKNYLFVTAPEGQDLVGYNTTGPNIDGVGLGNAFIASYALEAAVGGYATATVGLSASNLRYYNGGSGLQNPSIDTTTNLSNTGNFVIPAYTSGLVGQPIVLKATDITVDLGADPLGIDRTTLCVQSFNFNADFNLTPQQCMGSKGAKQQDIQFPIEASLSVDAEFGELEAANLIDVLCDENTFDINIRLREPSCTGSGDLALWLRLEGATLDSESFSSSYGGDNETVTLNFTVTIGGPQDTTNGVFLSGITA